MTSQTKREIQLATEKACSNSHVAKELRIAIETHLPEFIKQGAEFIKQYTDFDGYYPSKMERIREFTYQTEFGRNDIVIEILSTVMPSVIPQQIQSVAARLASKLGMDDKIDGIKTASELIGVVSHTGAYEFIQPRDSETGSILVRSCFEPSQEMVDLVNAGAYLPPMIVPPRKLVTNESNAYLSGRDGVTLGNGNYHPYDLPLDVLNNDNAIALCIDERMLAFTEEPKKAFDSGKKYDECPNHLKPLYVQRKKESFENLVATSNDVYNYLLEQDNKFYLTHRPDERIRLYDQGYYVGHQASNYKKALIDTHEKELITGYVPPLYDFKGVSPCDGNWGAEITVKKELIRIGSSPTQLGAAKLRDAYIVSQGLRHKLQVKLKAKL